MAYTEACQGVIPRARVFLRGPRDLPADKPARLTQSGDASDFTPSSRYRSFDSPDAQSLLKQPTIDILPSRSCQPPASETLIRCHFRHSKGRGHERLSGLRRIELDFCQNQAFQQAIEYVNSERRRTVAHFGERSGRKLRKHAESIPRNVHARDVPFQYFARLIQNNATMLEKRPQSYFNTQDAGQVPYLRWRHSP